MFFEVKWNENMYVYTTHFVSVFDLLPFADFAPLSLIYWLLPIKPLQALFLLPLDGYFYLNLRLLSIKNVGVIDYLKSK
jgi:hypothetical protein